VDAIELLRRQHREVEELFERFGRTDAIEERGEIARTVTRELRLHTAIEEELFYPALRSRGGELEDAVLEDLEEHHAVEVMLDELDGVAPTDERFAAKFTVISEMVLHHVEEEEDEQFPMAREALDAGELDDLGRRMLERYENLRAEVESEGRSKEELYQEARDLGIEGRSQMSKRELADAIAAHRG
jgi:hemerythrin superfamily protein